MALSVRQSVRPSVCRVVHNTCGQDITRIMWPRLLELSLYTSYVKRKKLIFQGQRSNFKVTGLLQRIMALGSYQQNIARTMWPRMIKLSMCTSYGKSKKPIYFQGKRSNFKVTGPLQSILAVGSLWAGYSKNYVVWDDQTQYVQFIWKEEEAYLFSRSKVTSQGHWTFTKNYDTWILVGRI